MAKKRLNKKVALIGSVVFLLLGLVAVGVVLRLSRDPEKLIKDGDAALLEKDYERAARSYLRARAWAKSDSLRVEILYKLADVFLEADKWNNVLGCWNEIIRIDSKSIKARFGRLKYFYIMADSGAGGAWREVASQASEFVEMAENTDLLNEDTAQWESFETREDTVDPKRLGPYLYMLRGRAIFEMTRMGAVTDPDESLAQAVDDLQKVRELEPANVDVYWHLSQTEITKGNILASRGNLEEKDKAAEQANELLEQAVEVAATDVTAHVNLLRMKPYFANMTTIEQVRTLEPEYLSLVDKFPSEARAFSALATFYMMLGHEGLDRAMEAIEKAIELDNENVTYAINAANLHHRKFRIYGQAPELDKAIETAQNALTLPAAQEKGGPWGTVNRTNRILLYSLLASCYIEQVLEPYKVRTDSETQQWLTNAEQVVHEIEQLLGSGEDPRLIKWQGMLELAKAKLGKGDRNTAIRKLYATYEQLKASERRRQGADPQLSYALAKLFEDTVEVGAVTEFLTSALLGGAALTNPEALLDYAEVFLKLRIWPRAINNIDTFEKNFRPNDRSRMLRIRAYIGAGQLDQAEEELANIELDDPNTIKLNLELIRAKIARIQGAMVRKRREESLGVISQWLAEEREDEDETQVTQATEESTTAELKGYTDTLTELVERLLSIEPNSVAQSYVVTVCNNYITEGETNKAEDLVDRFLEYFPDDMTVLFYKKLLSEPQPDSVSQQRRKEIEKAAILDVADPARRSVGLGLFYEGNNEPNNAIKEFKKILAPFLGTGGNTAGPDDTASQEPEAGGRKIKEPQKTETQDMPFGEPQRLAAGHLFDIALRTEHWPLAEQVVDLARRENIDDCEGNFFAARLAFTKEEYKNALARIDECLRQRPVFSRGFMLKSNINMALGNEHASIENARKAAALNPLDGLIAKVLANALYQRNKNLGDNVSPDQMIEARDALDRAAALNLGDLQLRSFYAEYISETEPMRALAIRQFLQKTTPSVRNAVLLGQLATRIAFQQTDTERTNALLAIAASSFEQAKAIDPQNRLMLNSYAEYYRRIGQEEKAEELLTQSQDRRLLWNHYLQSGRLDEAKGILEQLYQAEPKDSAVLRGLLLVTERTGDRQAAKKYSEELLTLEDSMQNRLIQIQTFLDVGLVKEAEYKLQSFREKFPDEPRALLLDAWLTMRQGQLEKALELANRSLEAEQNEPRAWRLRGEINRLMANYDQAIIDLKRSKSLSDEPSTRLSLARSYIRAGRIEDAITELKSTIENPRAPMEAGMLLEQVYKQSGRREALIKFYRDVLEKYPDNLLWYIRAADFAFTTQDFATAEQLYALAWQKGLRDGRTDPEALDGYLKTLIKEGKLNKLFEQAAKYVDGYCAPIAYLRMAEAKMKLGDRTDAIQYCRKAIDKAGTDETFVFNILQSMHALLGQKQVEKYCDERLRTAPNSLAANYTMFNLANINGQYNKAIQYIDRCLEIIQPDNPLNVDYTMSKARVLNAAYSKTSDKNYLQQAISTYESLLDKMPNNTTVLNNLAYMMAENNERPADALKYAKHAYQTRPNDPSLMDTYAYTLYRNDRFDEAAELVQSALQQFEQGKIAVPADVYEHLGMIKEKLGLGNEAIAAYKQALEAGQNKLSEAAMQRIEAAIERVSQR